MSDATVDLPSSNCGKISKVILDIKASALKPLIEAAAHRAFKFLSTSRKGFYCALCDYNTHKYFNEENDEIELEYAFCSEMVKETLNYYLFKYLHFVKLSRLYSQFLVNCDLEGKYNKSKYLKHEIKFFNHDQMLGDLESCKKGFEKPGAIKSCQGFCKRFNPTKFDEELEGELGKLFSYAIALEKLTLKMKAKKGRTT